MRPLLKTRRRWSFCRWVGMGTENFLTVLWNSKFGFSSRGERKSNEKKKKRRRKAEITKFRAELSCWIEIQEICGAVNNYQVSDRCRVAAESWRVSFKFRRVRDVFHDLQSQILRISKENSCKHSQSAVIRIRDSTATSRCLWRIDCRTSPLQKSDSAIAEICFRGSFSFLQ